MNCESIYIVIPAYNESENIKEVIDDWYPVIEQHNGNGNSRLVIVNDGSTDDTYEIICSEAVQKPLIVPLTKTNSGHGPSVIYGYRYAMDHNADYVFQTDSDGQTDPDDFAAFWDLRDEYDAVIGNRSKRGDGIFRIFVERIVCLLLRLYFGVTIPDANAPFRLMKTELLEKYIDRLPQDYDLPNIMLTTYFVYYKEKVTFREISFSPRKGGFNSINIKRIVKSGWRALRDFRIFRKEIRG